MILVLGGFSLSFESGTELRFGSSVMSIRLHGGQYNPGRALEQTSRSIKWDAQPSPDRRREVSWMKTIALTSVEPGGWADMLGRSWPAGCEGWGEELWGRCFDAGVAQGSGGTAAPCERAPAMGRASSRPNPPKPAEWAKAGRAALARPVRRDVRASAEAPAMVPMREGWGAAARHCAERPGREATVTGEGARQNRRIRAVNACYRRRPTVAANAAANGRNDCKAFYSCMILSRIRSHGSMRRSWISLFRNEAIIVQMPRPKRPKLHFGAPLDSCALGALLLLSAGCRSRPVRPGGRSRGAHAACGLPFHFAGAGGALDKDVGQMFDPTIRANGPDHAGDTEPPRLCERGAVDYSLMAPGSQARPGPQANRRAWRCRGDRPFEQGRGRRAPEPGKPTGLSIRPATSLTA